jgi:type IV secretory pathway TraG/TraD family ATPase VirD4
LLQLLTDDTYRSRVVPQVRDDVVRAFWENEFANWTGQYRTEAVSSVTNKIMPFLTNRRMRATVASQSRKCLDIRSVMDQGQILIVNLSRGRLGQDNSMLLGRLLLTSIEQAALTRADLPEGDRRDHFLFLDEFQSLVTPSTAIMLSESRKYHLCLTLSHQLTRQLDDETWNAVIGNVGTFVALRVGIDDATRLAPAFSTYPGQVCPEDLTHLPNFTAVARTLISGEPTPPFTLTAKSPPEINGERAGIVRGMSDRQFGVSSSR